MGGRSEIGDQADEDPLLEGRLVGGGEADIAPVEVGGGTGRWADMAGSGGAGTAQQTADAQGGGGKAAEEQPDGLVGRLAGEEAGKSEPIDSDALTP